jgi:hypothetical protein
MSKKPKKWVMPKWMEPFRESFNNTGGNKIEDLMNDHATTITVNTPRVMLIIAVVSQVTLLTYLHNNGHI